MPSSLVDIEDSEMGDLVTAFGGSWASIQEVSRNVCEEWHHYYLFPDISDFLWNEEEVSRVTWPSGFRGERLGLAGS